MNYLRLAERASEEDMLGAYKLVTEEIRAHEAATARPGSNPRQWFTESLRHEIRSVMAQHPKGARDTLCDLLWCAATFVAKTYDPGPSYLRMVERLIHVRRNDKPRGPEQWLELIAELIIIADTIALPVSDERIAQWYGHGPTVREYDYEKAEPAPEDAACLVLALILESKK